MFSVNPLLLQLVWNPSSGNGVIINTIASSREGVLIELLLIPDNFSCCNQWIGKYDVSVGRLRGGCSEGSSSSLERERLCGKEVKT